jgi:hypothetical protein
MPVRSAGLNGVVIPDSYARIPLIASLAAHGLQTGHLAAFQGLTEAAWLGALALIVFAAPNTEAVFLIGNGRVQFRPTIVWTTAVTVLLVLGLFGISSNAPFLYFQF